MSMSIPTGDISNHSLLWYNSNDGRVVHSNAGTTGRFGGAALDTASLPGAVSALRQPSTYAPPVFGAGLDTANVPGDSTVVGTQTPLAVVNNAVTAVGFNSLLGDIQTCSTIVGSRLSPSGRCGYNSVSIGCFAGETIGNTSVAVGFHTMYSNTAASGPNATTAVGWGAGHKNAGNDCVYIGHAAGAEGGNFDRVICIGLVSPTQSDSFFARPIRYYVPSGTGAVPLPLHYIEATGEIVHVPPTEPKLVSKFVNTSAMPVPVTQTPVGLPDPCKFEIDLKKETRVTFSYQCTLATTFNGLTDGKRYECVVHLMIDNTVGSQLWSIQHGDMLNCGVFVNQTYNRVMQPGKHVIEVMVSSNPNVAGSQTAASDLTIYNNSAYCEAIWTE